MSSSTVGNNVNCLDSTDLSGAKESKMEDTYRSLLAELHHPLLFQTIKQKKFKLKVNENKNDNKTYNKTIKEWNIG